MQNTAERDSCNDSNHVVFANCPPLVVIYQWLAGAGIGLVLGSTQQQALDECVQTSLSILCTHNNTARQL